MESQKELPSIAQAVIGTLVLLGSVAVAFVMVRQGHADLVWSTFAVLLATVVGYYFGSSVGSAQKTKLLAGQPTPAPDVALAPAPQVMPPLSGPKQ